MNIEREFFQPASEKKTIKKRGRNCISWEVEKFTRVVIVAWALRGPSSIGKGRGKRKVKNIRTFGIRIV